MRSRVAQKAELARLERAGARRRHRDQLERALHALERIGLGVRRELAGEAEQQLRRSAAGRNQPDADFDEPHVQLGVRLHAIGVQRELASAAEREAERRRRRRETATGESAATCPESRARRSRACFQSPPSTSLSTIERSAPARERARILVADHEPGEPVALDAIERAVDHRDHAFAERVHLAVELEHGHAAARRRSATRRRECSSTCCSRFADDAARRAESRRLARDRLVAAARATAPALPSSV